MHPGREDRAGGGRLRPGRRLAILLVALGACGGCGGGHKASARPHVTCREHPHGPPQGECEAVIDRLEKVIPDDMSPDRGKDVCDCMAEPRELADCLQRVTTREEVDTCVNLVGGTSADARRPSHEDCAQAVAHVKQLAPDEVDDPRAQAMIEACEKTATRGEVECIQQAATLEDVNKCEPS